MPKRQVLTEKQINKIQLLRLRNFSYSKICLNLSITQHAVRKHCSHIKTTKKFTVLIKPNYKFNKYDHLLEEPVCQGKMYKDYVKEN